MVDEYITVAQRAQAELIIKKSRFIAYVVPVISKEEAEAFVAATKKRHWDAAHNVWAWRVGQDLPVERFSDDGEPSGTAGMPVLEVLRKRNITDCAVVVTRYFGGTLLGAGGLVRAYTESAVQGLAEAGVAIYRQYSQFRIFLPYNLLGSLMKGLEDLDSRIEEPTYGVDVEVKAWVRPQSRTAVEQMIREISQGSLEVSWTGEGYFVDGEK